MLGILTRRRQGRQWTQFNISYVSSRRRKCNLASKSEKNVCRRDRISEKILAWLTDFILLALMCPIPFHLSVCTSSRSIRKESASFIRCLATLETEDFLSQSSAAPSFETATAHAASSLSSSWLIWSIDTTVGLSLTDCCSGEYHVDALKPRSSMSLPLASSSTSTWIMPQCRSYMHIFISYKLQMWYDADDDDWSRRRFNFPLNKQLRWVRR